MQSLGEHMKQYFADEAMRKEEEAKNDAQDGLFDKDDENSDVVSFFCSNLFFINIL